MSGFKAYPHFIEFKYAYGRVLILRECLPTGMLFNKVCNALTVLFGKQLKKIDEERPLMVVGKPEISVLKKKWLFLELYDIDDLVDEFRDKLLERVPAPTVDTVYVLDIKLTDDPLSIPEISDHGRSPLV